MHYMFIKFSLQESELTIDASVQTKEENETLELNPPGIKTEEESSKTASSESKGETGSNNQDISVEQNQIVVQTSQEKASLLELLSLDSSVFGKTIFTAAKLFGNLL